MKQKKLGVLLSTAPPHPNSLTVAALCRTALAADVDVYLYLIDEGVANVRDERFLGLSAQGAKLFVCAYGCQQHHVETGDLGPAITLCGLVILSNMINGCDRFVAFN